MIASSHRYRYVRLGNLEIICMRKTVLPFPALLFGALLAACTPTVKVATDEPITINLNVNIKHEILVKVDRELDDLFSEDSELF